jgi:hypothetical protein
MSCEKVGKKTNEKNRRKKSRMSSDYCLSNATTQATALLSFTSALKYILPSLVLLKRAERMAILRTALFTFER